MREVIQTLERNAKDVRYGTVGVELHIHDGRVVKAVFNTAKVTVERTDAKSAKEVGRG
jgi:hypothetical protein